MGNKQTKIHLENASKTGVCTLTNCKLEELPSDLFKLVNLRSVELRSKDLKTNLRLILENPNCGTVTERVFQKNPEKSMAYIFPEIALGYD